MIFVENKSNLHNHQDIKKIYVIQNSLSYIAAVQISINFIIVCSFKILLYLVTMVIFEFHILRGPSKFYLI